MKHGMEIWIKKLILQLTYHMKKEDFIPIGTPSNVTPSTPIKVQPSGQMTPSSSIRKAPHTQANTLSTVQQTPS